MDARNVSFKANGDVDRKQSIDAVVVAGAVAVSVAYAPPVVDGASLAVSGAGAGARAVNKIQTGITARISDQNQQNRFEAGSVTVRALDQAEINSTIAAVAIAVAVSLGATAALSVAASLAQNEIGNTTLATMDGVRIAGAPAITVKADSRHHDRVGRGVGERGRGPGRRIAGGRRRQCAQPDRLVRDGAGQWLAHRRQCRQCLEYRCRHERHHQGNRGGRQRGLHGGRRLAGHRLGAGREQHHGNGRRARRTDRQQAVQPGRGVGHGRQAMQRLEAKVGAGAVAVAMGGVALAGAGAAAFNTSKAVTRACVDGLTQVDAAVRAPRV